jgi:hypothetical protein
MGISSQVARNYATRALQSLRKVVTEYRRMIR